MDEYFEGNLRRFLPFLPTGETLGEQSDLRAYGLDSMGTVELIAALERAYGVRFADEHLSLEVFATPGTLWAAINQLTASVRGGPVVRNP